MGNIVSGAIMKKNQKVQKKTKPRMDEILRELKQKMRELDDLKNQLMPLNPKKISAQMTRRMLEEIVVPPLELIKEHKSKK